MKCGDCANEVAADEKFCGSCGCPNPNFGKTNEGANAPAPSPASGAEPEGAYARQITRQNPGCMIFLVDQSGSMDNEIKDASGRVRMRKDVVAETLNRVLDNLVLQCVRGNDPKPRDYFDVGVWGYGDDKVRRAFDADLITVSQLAGSIKRMEQGSAVRFEPVAGGNTPMADAFRAILPVLKDWTARRSASFPPVVINLTDGEYTGDNPAPIVRELMQLGTDDGRLILINCHISNGVEMVSFPASSAGFQDWAAELFEMSTPLPELMRGRAKEHGYDLKPGARGYVFNADVNTMIKLYDIGTPVQSGAKPVR